MNNKLWNLFYFMMTNLVFAQDCLIDVPSNPLSSGMFEPWFVSTKDGSITPCSQLVPETAVFVEVTILDKDTGKFFIYNPLVVDKKTITLVSCEGDYKCFMDVNEVCDKKKGNLSNTNDTTDNTNNNVDVKSTSPFIIVNFLMMSFIFGMSVCFNL
jgi:hypothetical protein